MTDLQTLRDMLNIIVQKKSNDVLRLIREAVQANVHVDVLICAEPHLSAAWEFLAIVGFTRGLTGLIDIVADLPENHRSDHFQVKFNNILPC